MSYTINKIQDLMRDAGSHWFDPDTLRFFSCRIGQQVYEGPEGIYFVTSEKSWSGQRAYSVRQFVPAGIEVVDFTCPSCGKYQHGMPAETARECEYCGADVPENRKSNTNDEPEIRTVGEFSALTRARAHSKAAKLAGTDAIVTRQVHRVVSDVEQFAHDISTHCSTPIDEAAAGALIRRARQHHKLMEDYCNGMEIYDEDDEPLPVLARCRSKIETIAKSLCAGVVFSGDPRGCTVKLTFPDAATNDFGKEGWCVPN
jgi:predicted RNA-binding Zn-ribbon protein involved in translation (DUF1610 family)